MTVDFAFSVGENVEILGSGLPGVVKALYIDEGDVQEINVRYFDRNGACFEEYFRVTELAHVAG